MAADPYATAQVLLDKFVERWPGRRLPKTRYVAEGESVAWDGEQVTVSVGLTRPGLPGQPTSRALPPRAFPVSTDFAIQVVRKRGAGLTHSGGRQTVLPTAAEDAAAGAKAGSDLAAMLATLLLLRENADVVSHATKIAIGSARPVGPLGDLVGTEGNLTILIGH